MAKTKKLFASLTRRGPYRVLRGELAFAGMPGLVYTPESGMNLPAVAFGHDWLVAADRYAGTLEHLASWGIVRAAPKQPKRGSPRRCSTWPSTWGRRSTSSPECGWARARSAFTPPSSVSSVTVSAVRPRSSPQQARAADSSRPWRVFPSVSSPPAERPAASLAVPGLILADPGDPMSLRSNAVPLARAWKAATLRDVQKVTAGGLVEGRRLSRLVKLPGADKGTQKTVRALLTGYLLYTLTDDKTYRDFADAEAVLPKTEVMDPFSDDPVDLENKVAALLKP